MNASHYAHCTSASSACLKLAMACAALALPACAITEIRDSDNRSSWSVHLLREVATPSNISSLTYVRSSALGWQQTGSEYTFGLIWREAVIARDANACALVVLLNASQVDIAQLTEQKNFFSTLGNCHVVPLSKG